MILENPEKKKKKKTNIPQPTPRIQRNKKLYEWRFYSNCFIGHNNKCIHSNYQRINIRNSHEPPQSKGKAKSVNEIL